jgi:hypothetical protein
MLKTMLAIICLMLLSCGQGNKQSYNISDKRYYSDFQIIYDDSGIDSYSSLDSLFSRSYTDSTSKIKCALTIVEKQSILKCMEANEFLDLPNILPEDHNGTCTLPAFPVKIIVIIGKTKKSVLYEGMCDVKHKNQLERFNKVLDEIQKSIYTKNEIKSLERTNWVFE